MKLTARLLVAVMMLAAPAAASASTIDFMGLGKADTVGIHSPGLGDMGAAHAGELLWNWIGAAPDGLPSSSLDSFYTYCVDVNHFLQDPQTVTLANTSTLVTPGVSDAGGKAAWLVNTYAPAIHAAPINAASNAASAGLQLAIWEILYDPTPNLSSGNFYLIGSPSPAIVAQAQSYLNALFYVPGNDAVYNTSSSLWLSTPGAGQAQILATPIIPNPEPGTLILLGSGLLVAGRRFIRRRRPTDAPLS